MTETPITNTQVALFIGAFIMANGTTIGLVVKWAVNRAIKYTHLERDVKELQDAREDQVDFNTQILKDMKGLSIKLDNTKKEIHENINRTPPAR